jgi:serralysin
MASIEQVSARPVSGIASVDALIDNAQPWNYIGRNVLRYSFSVTDGVEASRPEVDLATRTAFNDVQREAVRSALAYISSVTGIQFQEVAHGGLADVHFANADVRGKYAGALTVNAWNYSSSAGQVVALNISSWVYLDSAQFGKDNLVAAPGNYGYETLLHEIGHVLGLKHPFEGEDLLAKGNVLGMDNTETTLMSYTHVGGYHATYGPYDLAALDWLFGGDGLGGNFGADTGRSIPLKLELGVARVGTSGADQLTGSVGDDVFTGLGGADTIAGGDGMDTAIFAGARSSYTIAPTAAGFSVKSASTNASLTGIERLQFDDGKVALDLGGHAGQAYRLYQAAFDRQPDSPGLGFQMNALDEGLALREVARNFIASPEFARTYGAVDDKAFVGLLYANVLDRAPDAPGLAYHLDRLAHGAERADILVGFSESPENQALVIGAIQAGIGYA